MKKFEQLFCVYYNELSGQSERSERICKNLRENAARLYGTDGYDKVPGFNRNSLSRIFLQDLKGFCETASHIESNEEQVSEADRVCPQLSAWNQLSIEVIDNETIKYKVGDDGWERRNYTELGFMDKRRRLPNKLWRIFLYLATPNGELRRDIPIIKPKDIDRIRKTLRQFFKLQDSPIKYDSGARKYCCEFGFDDLRDW